MVREPSMKIISNFCVFDASPCNVLRPHRGSELSWDWRTKDFSDVPVLLRLALKFHSTKRALKFKEWFEEAKVLNKAVEW